MDTILFEVSDGIATITLNRPDALNALTPEMNDRLPALIDQAEADEGVRVVVLTGAGRAFSAGAEGWAIPIRQGCSPQARISPPIFRSPAGANRCATATAQSMMKPLPSASTL